MNANALALNLLEILPTTPSAAPVGDDGDDGADGGAADVSRASGGIRGSSHEPRDGIGVGVHKDQTLATTSPHIILAHEVSAVLARAGSGFRVKG